MEKILTVRELVTILIQYNMDALVYANANGVPTGISLNNLCVRYDRGGDDETEKKCKEIVFDIQEKEK